MVCLGVGVNMKNIAVLGVGYVGLVTGACLALNKTNRVTCIDIDSEKIENLKKFKMPIYEKDLEGIVKECVKEDRLFFDWDIPDSLEENHVIFIAVGTPSNEDGSVNLDYVKSACNMIRDYTKTSKIVVMKSTVPVGTHNKMVEWLGPHHDIVSNPEFLREGVAVDDFMNGDRIVIGCQNNRNIIYEVMNGIYSHISSRIMFTDNASAEIIKYTSNTMLAMRLAFINEIAELCDKVGADVLDVKEGVGLDSRIGNKFLNPGPGYGGSCFPKDTLGLLHIFAENGLNSDMIASTIASNNNHKAYTVNKLLNNGVNFEYAKVAILGMAFKPDTDDTRESATHLVKDVILQLKGMPAVHDPVVKEGTVDKLEDVLYCADIIILMTEWDCYKGLTSATLRELTGKNSVVLDTRNIWDREAMEEAGFTYYGMGR